MIDLKMRRLFGSYEIDTRRAGFIIFLLSLIKMQPKRPLTKINREIAFLTVQFVVVAEKVKAESYAPRIEYKLKDE